MDEDGLWRSPSDWPGDEPPVDGWIQLGDGKWHAPGEASPDIATSPISVVVPERTPPERSSRSGTSNEPKQSLQAQADIRAMLFVGCAALVAGAVLLMAIIGQPSADASLEATATTAPQVVFAAETDQALLEQRREIAAAAPAETAAVLAGLVAADQATNVVFDETLWQAQSEDCLGLVNQVLIDRSAIDVQWADNLECVPSNGAWTDIYLGQSIERTIDADVVSLVPLPIVNSSGGSQWTPSTRQAFLSDVEHPATLLIVAKGSGHNPRGQGPDEWRPSNAAVWCGYAIDWVAVKDRWELTVTDAERTALQEMLGTCDDPGTSGPHLSSMLLDTINAPVIDRIDPG